MTRNVLVLGPDGDLSDAICRRLAKLDYDASAARKDAKPGGHGSLHRLLKKYEEDGRPIDACISHTPMSFELLTELAAGMAQRGWGRIVEIELTDGRGAEAQAERRIGQQDVAKLASQLRSRGVTINTIVSAAQADGASTAQPASGKLSKAEEIAGLAVYLASEEAGFVSGARIAFDVGRRLD
jgi:NAD(P)-dependent dehydrogenase (short-subunit alcohol dehydrogenase family)